MKQLWRILSLVLVIALLAGVVPAAGADSLTFGLTYKSNTVNLRSQPTSSSAKLGTYAAGEWMQILGDSGSWYRVMAQDGKTGYMSKNYVEVTSEKAATIGIVTNQNATAFLNLRQQPSYNAKVLGIYYNGAPCVLLSEANGWYHVRVNGEEGYFRKEYLRLRQQVFSEEVATIVTPGLTAMNLRTGPDKSYGSIRQFAGGSYVMVLQRGNTWWKVAIDGYVGYMDASYLKEGVLTPQEAAKAGGKGPTPSALSYAIVNNPKPTQVLNLRESASTTSTSIGQFRSGARVTVLEQGTEWCRVMTGTGLTGFMMTKYLTLINLPTKPVRLVLHPKGSYVNLRALPTSYGAVLARVPSGSAVTMIAPGDSWAHVSYGGLTGYMSVNFLE